jgi:hypothetical protein
LSIVDFEAEMRTAVKVRKVPVVFLLGAGCSADAGIELARGVINKLRGEVGVPPLGPDDPTNYEHEIRTHLHSKADEVDFFRRLCEGAEPTAAHRTLGRIICDHRHSFPCVLTTNFDSLIEEGIGKEGPSPDVIASHDERQLHNAFHGARTAVLKLHGCIRRHNIRNTARELMDIERNLAVQLNANLPGTTRVVVVGYAGGDNSVGLFLKKLVDGGCLEPSNVYWCSTTRPEAAPGNKVIDEFRDTARWVQQRDFDVVINAVGTSAAREGLMHTSTAHDFPSRLL